MILNSRRRAVNKSRLRTRMLGVRDAIPSSEKKILDRRILQHLFAWNAFRDADSVFCYVSFRSEVDTFPVLQRVLSSGKRLLVPRVDPASRSMEAVVIESTGDLKPGCYGILEPDLEGEREASGGNGEVIDLVIAPGCAFTRRGDRLGYGGGYYDRFLGRLRDTGCVTCALTYDRLILPSLPVKDIDIPVDYLIIESGVLRAERNRT